ncbi:MGMT family protein [Candidatus Woesearchaeota archaeon]|nr:MGMT family protein [Candidatus Woesearchaeota archaeon]
MPTLFEDKIYAALKRVPRGRVTTYKSLAEAVGSKAYRAVGNAMNKNPYAPAVPCHRVVNSDGTLGGFAWGAAKKARMLEEEGVIVNGGRVVDFSRVFYDVGAVKR